MIKRKGGSQIGKLILNYKPFEKNNQISSDWGVLYTVGMIFLRAIR